MQKQFSNHENKRTNSSDPTYSETTYVTNSIERSNTRTEFSYSSQNQSRHASQESYVSS